MVIIPVLYKVLSEDLSTVDLQNLLLQTSEFLVFSLRSTTLLKEETTGQVFSYEFCKLFKSTFFTEHFRWLLLMITQILQIL